MEDIKLDVYTVNGNANERETTPSAEETGKIRDDIRKRQHVTEPPVKTTFVEFASRSTIHGLPQTVGMRRYWGQRCLWATFCILMVSGLILTVCLEVKTFLQYPTVINSMETPLALADLPDITVCRTKPLFFVKPMIPGRQFDLIEMAVQMKDDNCVYGSDGQCLYDYDNLTRKAEINKARFNRRSWHEKLDQFVNYDMTTIGFCEKFRTAEFITNSTFTTQRGGSQNMLDLVVKYNKDLLDADGARLGIQVSLHDATIPAFPAWRRVFLPINSSCSVTFHKITREALSSPFQPFVADQCVDTSSGQFVNPLKRYDVYTTDACRSECFVDFVVRQYGCRYYTQPGTERICSYTEMVKSYNKNRVYFRMARCNCTPPCRQTEYTVSTSCGSIENPDVWMIHLEVISDGPTQTKIIQTPIKTMESMLGSVGGLIGLFMGFSLVSLVELLEFLCLMCKQTATHSCSAKMRTRK